MQIKQLNEPIEVRITEWNTGGLLTRIEVWSIICYTSFPMFLQQIPQVDTCLVLTIPNLVLQGLRAFLPKTELINRTNKFTQLKDNVSETSF